MITRLAPAKINLTLEVLRKRDDGYHEIRSVIQAISLADTLTFEESDSFTFDSDMSEWEGKKSLVSKAATILRNEAGTNRGASIFVEKRIPLLSGLGGDSSDVATTLSALNEVWGLGASINDLVQLGSTLGSDVAFFFYGGTALMEGRGELISPLADVQHRWIVLAIPPVERLPGKTKSLYKSLKPNHYTDGATTAKMVNEIAGGKIDLSLLFDTFENVAFTIQPDLSVTRQHMLKMGAPNVHLAGSGPTLFCACDSRSQAEDLCSRLNGQHIQAFLSETLSRQQT